MEYFEPGEKLLCDYDGVFFDSEDRFRKDMNGETCPEKWNEYLNRIQWKKFLRECEETPYATETLLELQKMGILEGFLIRIHNFEEGREKTIIIRERGLTVPIHFVLKGQPKNLIYTPNKKIKLLDDMPENLLDWYNAGGSTIYFNPNAPYETKKMIKRMDSLLR